MDPGIIQQLVELSPRDVEEVTLFESQLDLVTQKKCIFKLENFTFGLETSFRVDLDGGNDGRSSSIWYFYVSPSGGNLIFKYRRYFNDYNQSHSDEDSSFWHYVEASVLEPNGMKMGSLYQSDLFSFTTCNKDNEVFWINKSALDLPFKPNGGKCLVVEATLKIFRMTPIVNTKLDRNRKGNDAYVGVGSTWMTNKPKPKTNYGAFLNSKDHSDVKIFSSDGQEFHAHKIVLRAGSEVFDAMFKSEMTESTTGIIKLDDMSAAAVTFLLNYLYCGEILPCTVNGKKLENAALFQASGVKTPSKDSKEKETLVTVTSEEALYVASKYRLDELRDFMDHSFRRFCNEENAISLLEMSKLYSLNCKEFLKNFIKNHPRILDKVLEHQC